MDKHVLILTESGPTDTGARDGLDVGGGFGPRSVEGPFRLISLGADGLRAQLANLVEVVEYVFDQTSDESGVSLDQIELGIEISSEGQISILGTGGKAGGRGAIKLNFKRVAKP